MTQDSRFSTTLPAALDGAALDETLRGDADQGRMDYLLAGAIGIQLTEPLATMRRAVTSFVASGKLSSLQAQPISEAIEIAQKIALQSQLLSNIASEKVRHAHGQVDLDAVVNATLDERSPVLRSRGVELYRSIKPVAVIVDLDLVTALVDAAIDWAAEPGQRLVISLEIKNWPAHGLLKLKTTQTVSTTSQGMQTTGQVEKLSWYLVAEIARAIGATLDRVASPDETLLMIEFPRTVRQMEGLTAMEMDFGPDPAAGLPSRALAGHRVLIITSDVRLREDTKLVCRSMGLIVDSVPSSLMAVRFCEMEKPELIIVDERFKDGKFDELRSDLLRLHPNFPFIEIAYDSNTLSMAGWMGEYMTRVNRDQLVSELPQALALEMAKVL